MIRVECGGTDFQHLRHGICEIMLNRDTVFRHGNESPSATNVVVVVVPGVVVSTKAFHFITDRRQTSHTQIGDNTIHNRTVSDFSVKP